MEVSEFERRLKVVADNIFQIALNSTHDAAVMANQEMLVRVFNENLGTEGQNIGQYSKGYAQYRKDRGLQTAKVDLQLEGDLKKDIRVFDTAKGVVIKFVNPLATKKGRDNEKRFKKTIFALTENESDNAAKNLELNFDDNIKHILDTGEYRSI